jgi:hypothetical protein
LSYVNEDVDGTVATQLIVVSLTAVKTATGAGSTVMILDAVIVRLQLSTNVQVSVYEPPQELCEPVITDVTLPLMVQLPL